MNDLSWLRSGPHNVELAFSGLNLSGLASLKDHLNSLSLVLGPELNDLSGLAPLDHLGSLSLDLNHNTQIVDLSDLAPLDHLSSLKSCSGF